MLNRNFVGTHFGGSMFSMTDPFYMIMMMQVLGRDYVVWDKAAAIRFKRPGKETLYADFRVTQNELDEIKTILETEKSVDRIYNVELADASGVIHAIVEKTLYVAKKGSNK